jgi:hypothetical protein
MRFVGGLCEGFAGASAFFIGICQKREDPLLQSFAK